MADSALELVEREFLRALNELGVRYLIVGVTAASVQGARVATENIDLWFEDLADSRIGFPGHFGMQPPAVGGKLGDRFDVVLTLSGLGRFAEEYERSPTVEIDGVNVRVLPLTRIIASKRAANRPKDRAALPALEAALAVLEEIDRDDD
jgi:predicted nucleotidyltransferase